MEVPENNKSAVIELQYLPPIPYFVSLIRFDKVFFEIHENFIKQSYRNRCRILTANGIEDLVIPLKKPHHHVPITEIHIDYRQNWPLRHWKALQTAYGKSPWFDHYSGDIKEILFSGKQLLTEFNLNSIVISSGLLGLDMKPDFTERFDKGKDGSFEDLRSCIHPKKNTENLGFYMPVKYIQNFGHGFSPSLSVIDLIFSEGPASLSIIKQSVKC